MKTIIYATLKTKLMKSFFLSMLVFATVVTSANAQNVGIGESAPATRLDLRGAATGDLLNIKTNAGVSRLYVKEDGNVGIGTTNPSEKLQVAGNVRIGNVMPNGSPGTNTAASGNILFFSGANPMSPHNSDNSDPLAIFRFNAAADLTYLVIGVGDANNATDGVVIQNYFSSWSHFFQTNGAAQKAGGGAWATLSDKRLKHNITTYVDGLNILEKINPVKYQYNSNVNINSLEKEYIGIIAQEV